MSTQGHLVVFVRTPRLGRVKTRLAADVGVLAAWQIYRKIAFTLLRRLGGVRTWRCWLALSGQRIDRTSRVWPPGWHRIAQGEGDLGRRMVSVVRAMPPGPVVIVGSDIPSIGPDDVSRAFRVLHEKDLVFGPAMDGGYWLIGFKRRPIPPGLFSEVRWSTRNALVDTLANTGGHSVTFLDLLEDIDSGASLYRWRTGIVPRHAYRPMLDR